MKIKFYGNKELLFRKKLILYEDSIHIWIIKWEEIKKFWNSHRHILNAEEIVKARGYRFYDDKMRYIAGKILTRMLLQQYLKVKKIFIETGKYGKPYHRKIPYKKRIQFNISHSGKLILAVFSYYPRVGIDVQEIKEICDYIDIANNFFSVEEALDIEKRGDLILFYQYWAAKEAYLKALGIGLSRGMDFFSIKDSSIIEKERVKVGWRIYPIKIEEYAAYVAIQEKGR